MIAGLFLNPGFLLIAAALISVPIIIHLINRMRFKRIRWAAMEFLLKAQKRTRRRLIIEQLLLLALRCFLIFLVGLLVSRFTGCGENNLSGKPNLHIVLLDDTLSMQDACWKNADGSPKTCFEVATKDFLIKKIGKGLAQSKTNDQLMVIELSHINDTDFQPRVFKNLNDSDKLKEFENEIKGIKPSVMHVDMQQGINEAKKIIASNAQSAVTLHILSDYRHLDWSGKAGEKLDADLLELVKKNKEIKIRPIDTVFPKRVEGQGNPMARDNIGILDVQPSARVVGVGTPVRFTALLYNFSGKQAEVRLGIRDDGLNGKDVNAAQLKLSPPNPIRLSPNSQTEVTFEYRFTPELKGNESHFVNWRVRLETEQLNDLENDGLLADNTRYVTVEVREKVPVLVIDGGRSKAKDKDGDKEGGDAYIIARCLPSIPGASYKVVFADDLPESKGDPTAALERPDLKQYPTIFIMNVAKLQPRQIENLEAYVKDGGGVAFYMGKEVMDYKHYNDKLYRKGEGVFPAPLKGPFFYPPLGEPELPTKKENDTFELITREDKFDDKIVPIFSAMFEEPKQRESLANLPIHRYWKIDRGEWKQNGRVMELATLPNEKPASDFAERAVEIKDKHAKAVLVNEAFKKYHDRLRKHLNDIAEKTRPQPGVEYKAYHLADQIDLLLKDAGSKDTDDPRPDMIDFFTKSDDDVQALKAQLISLREDVRYGDAFVVAQTYGKGRVVAVMSTLGKEWNEWAGGPAGSVLFMPFIWEMQNFLSSPGKEGNLTVGTNLPPLMLDAKAFEGVQLKMIRKRMKSEHEAKATEVDHDAQFGKPVDGKIPFFFTNHREPGLYISELIDVAEPTKPIARFGHVFNVDTAREGQLQRVSSDDLESGLVNAAKEITGTDSVRMVQEGTPDEVLVSKTEDLSESPWLFLILLLVLVAEQALAVHLSFHLKTNEDMTPAGVRAS
jgi:hypothetical protein